MQNVTILVYCLSALQVIATLIIAWMTIACPSASGPISHLSLLTISPSNSNTGPTVWMGLYASCSQRNTNEQTFCTSLTFKLKTTYDLSVLPQNAPGFVLESPPSVLKIIVNLTLALSHAFLLLVLWMVCRVYFESMSTAKFERRFNRFPLLPLLGLFLIAIGLVNFFVLQLYFDMVRDHFNEFVRLQGAKGPNLVASRGQAFLLAYLGYGLAGVSLIVASVDREKRRHHDEAPVIATQTLTSLPNTLLPVGFKIFDNQAVNRFVTQKRHMPFTPFTPFTPVTPQVTPLMTPSDKLSKSDELNLLNFGSDVIYVDLPFTADSTK